MSNSENSIQHKIVIDGYVYLINYYYIIEDSITNFYRTTVDYLYPKPVCKKQQEFGEFVIIDEGDTIEPPLDDRWYNPAFMQSIRRSLYFPKYEYSAEELEKLGYKPITKNSQFKNDKYNCFIYSDKHKYNVLQEFIKIWQLNKININLISGLYDPDEYELFSDFNAEMTLFPGIKFHNTHLHDFNKESILELIQKNETTNTTNTTNTLNDTESVNLTIINNPQFEIDINLYSQLTKNKSIFIVFDNKLDNFNKFMDYISIPANQIEELCKLPNNSYPVIHTRDDLYVIYSNPEYDALVKQLNYLRF